MAKVFFLCLYSTCAGASGCYSVPPNKPPSGRTKRYHRFKQRIIVPVIFVNIGKTYDYIISFILFYTFAVIVMIAVLAVIAIIDWTVMHMAEVSSVSHCSIYSGDIACFTV